MQEILYETCFNYFQVEYLNQLLEQRFDRNHLETFLELYGE